MKREGGMVLSVELPFWAGMRKVIKESVMIDI
jgi:hypothetical protein